MWGARDRSGQDGHAADDSKLGSVADVRLEKMRDHNRQEITADGTRHETAADSRPGVDRHAFFLLFFFFYSRLPQDFHNFIVIVSDEYK